MIQNPSGVRGGPLILLRLEGGALLGVACIAYATLGWSWWLFAALFLAPDISMLAYLVGPRIGAICYNAAHTSILPIWLGAAGFELHRSLPQVLAVIWLAHIGFDRLMGYGLKYDTAFGHTHLGMLGTQSQP